MAAVRPRNKMARAGRLEPLGDGLGEADQPQRLQSKRDIMNAIRQKSPGKRLLTGRQIKRMDGLKMAALRIGTGAGDETNNTLGQLETTLNTTARRYNDLKRNAEMKQSKLEALLDQLHTLEVENKSLKEQTGDNPETQALKQLERDESAVRSEMDELKFYRMQLENLIQRLYGNQVKFEGHIGKAEDAFQIMSEEFTDVQVLRGKMDQARVADFEKLGTFMKEFEYNREQRKKDMDSRESEVREGNSAYAAPP